MRFYYQCTECGLTFDIKPNVRLCPACRSAGRADRPLRGVLETICEGQPAIDPATDPIAFIHELLPVEHEFFPSIPVGMTPLWKPENLRKQLDLKNLFIKDDTLNPTGSLKDRASYLVAAFAKKYRIDNIVVASTGNAASSMAGVGAAAGIKVKIFIPDSAPKAKMVQALQYGADVTLVEGTYDLAFDKSIEYTDKYGGMNRNTAYNPLTLEGKKTAALEIFTELGKAPDHVFVPVGDGVILGGLYRGFCDLLKMGFIEKVPIIHSVQAEGSSAINRALADGDFSDPLRSDTLADSISVDVPRNGYFALKMLKKYGGAGVTVTDEEILSAQQMLASSTGLFAEPSSSSVLAGLLKARDKISNNDITVLLVTGSGLKDIEGAMKSIDI
ncbi:MAG: threonine synthase [Spirochaetales bacterium]|uniref:Threonine synthase n=1 Tax=Candidatus Thalassospirochaeta sargassi TaxID=3119039 RepID=A0AAJ1MN01_9SPIO|nr:threonine synthase [Spirochaetales bacterium]